MNPGPAQTLAHAQATPTPDQVPGPLLGQPQLPPPGQPGDPSGVAGLSGGETLEQALALRDIHPPGTPGLWPPAPGWWVVLTLLIATLAALGTRVWRAHRARARRRRILAELAAVGARVRGVELAAAVSALLKRVALARFHRAEVAPLTGQAWLDFLDRHGGAGRFSAGPGRVLAEGPYAPALDLDPQALLDLARDWVRRNT